MMAKWPFGSLDGLAREVGLQDGTHQSTTNNDMQEESACCRCNRTVVSHCMRVLDDELALSRNSSPAPQPATQPAVPDKVMAPGCLAGLMDVPVTECEPLDECRWPDGDLRYLLLDGTNNCKSEGLVYVFFFWYLHLARDLASNWPRTCSNID
ncbi:hypothetical protein VFPPC_17362 [Pochonia chlamydosporia 170]|uniref:Uncharacterized protein n=1 Tax=Pochonia chlamydosporia 170 TaxID=1380566 RepID=A0A219ASB9_METCM|nr:hypothetical protein VFPPC_17362 [Pochonia chlamydosporia 170]OWT43489.1 hypothetical protein VFPPC_17362 [Pochonia chlamydosporia 170]